MRTNLKLFISAFALLAMVSCVQAQQSETRNLGSFSKVSSGGSWEVILTEGNQEEVRIEVRGVDLSKVKTEINGDELNLGLERGSYRNVQLKFYVTYRNLEGVSVSGSGDMEVTSPVRADQFSIGLSGSGDISMKELVAGQLMASISGSAEIKIADGEVESAEIKQSGSGDFKGENLAIESLYVSKSGSGDTHVGDLGEISVRSSGSGDVVYSGSPRLGEIKTSGSSRIRKR
ncbi:head GIN domain-containing protein [Algoriphagus formosus]|uniref:DUF2807 domain-containing protein n=1 Tax=Algoriphagus formosus TaxID=2007308 RepID=A0A4V3AQP0_9BACT|nr:head GIN domain-containing protein [Algoriphagus aquimaris]TDK43527.1 DUF2807 domain-containing protein [Algoriphagus aquimaris]